MQNSHVELNTLATTAPQPSILATQTQLNAIEPVWQVSSHPTVLADLFIENKHIVIWQREKMQAITRYLESVFSDLGQGLRGVYSLDSLKQSLQQQLPQGTSAQDEQNKQAAIADIYLLSDMLTCLFDCKEVGLRLAPMSKAMCPRFHVDNIPARLVCTYLGNGTQWLPTDSVNHEKLGHGANGLSDDKSGLYQNADVIGQLNAFDVGILKGSAWSDDKTKAVVHRSCPIEPNQQRVLLTLDPM